MAGHATPVYAALAVLDTCLAATGRDRQRRLTKPLLMPALMVGCDRPTRTGKDRIPVLVYSTVLVTMSLAALDSQSSKAAAGGALLMASDSLLAFEKLGDVHLPGHGGLVMATYASAQALLARP